MNIFEDLYALFFPRTCICCGKNLFDHEELVCLMCIYSLPKTNFHLSPDNPVSRLFWGRAWIENAASCYYFAKGGRVQQMIHHLKYKDNKEIGVFLGKTYGEELKKAAAFPGVESIIPVPLHPKRQRKRGYNQSEVFADGLSESLDIPVEPGILIRSVASQTQTRKSKFSRWQNVESIFVIKTPDKLENRHVLLVDDVITTGATLEACIHTLQTIPGVKVSVASIAAVV
jgi:ComF family protein